MTGFIIFFVVYVLLILLYSRLAEKYRLFAEPNQRSSHVKITITGAGFVFPLAFCLPVLITQDYIHYRALLTGLFLISLISYLDDLKTMRPHWRILIHVIAVSLLLWQTGGLFSMKLWQLLPAFIMVVGIINSYNFMDGINGMHAFYSLVGIGTIYFLKLYQFPRLPVSDLYISMIASLLAFSVFNARKSAKCFSGDVGSISMAFIFSFLIIELMVQGDSIRWILLLGVYGLDSVGTIILRIIRRENITQPHRSHFYQYLANERKMPHVAVSLLYALVQLALNCILVTQNQWISFTAFAVLTIIYAILRLRMEGPHKLFVHYSR